VITDGALTLAPLRLEDAVPHLAGEDAELVRWLNGRPGTLAGVESYIRSTIEQWAAGGPKLTFGIRTDGVLAGTTDVNLAPPEAKLAYGLYPAWRGRGLATRAVLLVCRYLRDRGDVDRAVIVADPRNRRSAAVAERAGFSPAASRPNEDGEPMNVWTLEIRGAGAEEIPLAGGNVNAGVVRVGDTVRRPAGPWTPAVHALLTHLHEVGFHGAPRPLGLDEQGREVLAFVPGTTVWPDRFAEVGTRGRLARVGRMIRDFHDAVSGFTPPPDAAWRVVIPPEDDGGGEIIAHHDLAPWNLVTDGETWTFIDWDVAGPGSRLWDLAYAVKAFVPLSADPAWQRPDAADRVRILADAYGLDEDQRHRLAPMLARRARAMYDLLAMGDADGTQPWARLWREGHGKTWDRDTTHIRQNEQEWLNALLA
jgi:RimJ/RimL family protein N-acetyltransferase